MSNPYQNNPYQKEEQRPSETVDDLMLRDDETGGESEDRTRTASSVRDIASRIPESLSAIGRDISRTIERAMSVKDDYVVAVKDLAGGSGESRSAGGGWNFSQSCRGGWFFSRRGNKNAIGAF